MTRITWTWYTTCLWSQTMQACLMHVLHYGCLKFRLLYFKDFVRGPLEHKVICKVQVYYGIAWLAIHLYMTIPSHTSERAYDLTHHTKLFLDFELNDGLQAMLCHNTLELCIQLCVPEGLSQNPDFLRNVKHSGYYFSTS